jgi:serine/threonine protein kinase
MGAPVQPGQILGGKYRVERVLGEGGMGVVVAATRVALGDQVALKFLLHDAARHPDRVARFTREAQAAVKIRSDHVVKIIDVGTLDQGQPYIVMDLLEGEDLAQRLERSGRLAVGEAVDLLMQACDAIAAAHRAGIIHRDLKPANLFLTTRANGEPVLKVLDFGISKFTEAADLAGGPMTQTSSILGSPSYMSPEQLRSSRDVDVRTDIWSLGVIAFELVTNKLPFDFDSVPELCSAILMSPAPAIRGVRADVSDAFDAVVARCLEKEPARRYQTADELAAALQAAAPTSKITLPALARAEQPAALVRSANLPGRGKTEIIELPPATVAAPPPAAPAVPSAPPPPVDDDDQPTRLQPVDARPIDPALRISSPKAPLPAFADGPTQPDVRDQQSSNAHISARSSSEWATAPTALIHTSVAPPPLPSRSSARVVLAVLGVAVAALVIVAFLGMRSGWWGLVR